MWPVQSAEAQDYPTKKITIVVTLASGSTMDVLARLLADGLQRSFGQPVIIDNQPIAAGTVGAANVAKAPADGYTLLVTSSGVLAIAPSLYKTLNFDAEKSFVPIAFYQNTFFVLAVNTKVPATSIAALVTLSRQSPKPLSFSSPGAGTPQHLLLELTKSSFSAEFVHVPYNNTMQALTDIVGGHVSAGFVEAGSALPLIRDGQLRAVAISSDAGRRHLPETPVTNFEVNGSKFEPVGWHAMLAPSATPREVLDKLHRELSRTINSAEFNSKVSEFGLIPVDNPQIGQMQTFMRSQREKWGSVIGGIGLLGSR